MITPKQIESSHSGRDTRRPGKTRRRTRSPKSEKQDRELRTKSSSDPLFKALRDELGL